MAENEQYNADRKPDISFGSTPSGGTQRPPQGAGARPVQPSDMQRRGQSDTNGMRGTARPSNANMQQNGRPPRAARPRNNDDVSPVIRSDMPRRQGRPSGDGRPMQGRPPQNGRPVPGNRPPQNGRPPLRKDPPPARSMERSEMKKPVNTQSDFSVGGEAAVKKRFTKKQALQVTGLIFMLILILGLAVFLVFNYYYGLINHKAEDISNSEPMTYSDVDFSKADTFEKAKEDEKLKELTAQAEKITSSEVMNILLIGEDLRDTTEERSVGNTDVMMLISVNKKDNTITLTSLMRDCYVAFKDDEGYWYSDRINAAYWYGGIKLTKNTVEDYLKVKIDRYVLVNFRVFIDIVDALGGIDMHVTDLEANGDPDAPRSDKEHRGMQNPLDEQNKYLGNKVKTDYIKKGGDLHLNGNQALAYARLRYVGDADFDRTKRQRKVINEMIKESRSMSLVQMDKLATKVLPQVTTDVTRGELAGLLIEMLEYRNYKVQEMRIPADNTFTNEFIDGKAVLSVDFPANVELFREKAYGTVKVKEREKSEDGKDIE